MTEPVRFDVQDILASDGRAIVGEVATRIRATGKVIESPFAIILTISGTEITRLLMLENSFAVSRAARVQVEGSFRQPIKDPMRNGRSRWRSGMQKAAIEQADLAQYPRETPFSLGSVSA